MTEHYYSKNPQVKSDPFEIKTVLRNINFHFHSDTGVFSKKEVDFGSRLLIENFSINHEVEGPILDVGCGYGAIGITIAKCFSQREVHLVDINDRALKLAKGNAVLNGVNNIHIYESSVYHQVVENDFAVIISNPPIRAGKKIVHEILESSAEYLTQGGALWIVIQKKQGAPSAMEKMNAVFGNVEIVIKKKGYIVCKSVK